MLPKLHFSALRCGNAKNCVAKSQSHRRRPWYLHCTASCCPCSLCVETGPSVKPPASISTSAGSGRCTCCAACAASELPWSDKAQMHKPRC